LALAGLLAAMPTPAPTAPAPELPPGPAQMGSATATPGSEIDLGPVLDVMNDLVHRTEPVTPTPVEPPSDSGEKGDDEPAQVEPPPLEDNWPHFRFVGSVISNRSCAFIIDHEGVAQTVFQGQQIGEYHYLLGISSEKLLVSDCQESETREYIIVDRPEQQPTESVVNMSNVVGINAGEVNEKEGVEMPEHFVPGSKEQFDAEQMRLQRLREYEERRNAVQRPTAAQPPNRSKPSTNPNQPANPNKNAANNKDVK
jgi:hypothetical protein